MTSRNDDTQQIAENVSKALREAGISQREAITRTGIPHPTFVRSITGKRPFNTDELSEIAALIGCSLSELMFHGTDEQPTKAAS